MIIKLLLIIVFVLLIHTIRHLHKNYRDIFIRLVFSLFLVVFVLTMITHPSAIFEGSLNGLKAWWYIVFPALLPFFIASELLMSFGIVRLMGVLLEPVMRPLFNIPGPGAFVVSIGFTSGYPVSSMVTARLRKQGLCTRLEAERLMSFTNNASPLFMLVAIPVGMFGNPSLGLLIAGAHYLGNLTLGLALRFYGRNDPEKISHTSHPWREIPGRAFKEMVENLRAEKRPIGKIVSDAIRNSITNLLNIGGFIILFAVLIKLLTELGIIMFISKSIGAILIPFGVSPAILKAGTSGIFEMTMGTKLVSETNAPLLQQLVVVALVLSWSGLSVLAQVATMISGTDIRMGLFVIARFFHAILAGIYTVILYRLLKPDLKVATDIVDFIFSWPNWATSLNLIGNSFLAFFILMVLFYLIGVTSYLFKLIK